MDGGGTFVKPSLRSSLGKEHLPGPPRGLGSLPLTRTRMLSEPGLGDGSLAFAPLPPEAWVWGQREAAAPPAPPPPSALSFDFLLKVIVSVGVRRIVAFPFIPPLDVTLNRVHFL